MDNAKIILRFLPAIFFSLLFSVTPAYAAADAPPAVAPFTTDETAKNLPSSPLMNIYDSAREQETLPLDKPHRTGEQLVTWTEDRVTAAMNVNPLQWDQHIRALQPDFAAYGLKEYQDYLNSSGIMGVLKSRNLRLNAIMDGNATLLSEGALSGSYRWLYQVPLMLSYYDADMTSLKGQKAQVQNQKLMVRVQLGRVDGAKNSDGIVIERWSITRSR